MWSDKLKGKDDKHVDYNFNPALDGDVVSTWENMSVAEKLKNHKWKFSQEAYDKKDDDDKTPEYNFDAKLDEDVIDTQDHLRT